MRKCFFDPPKVFDLFIYNLPFVVFIKLPPDISRDKKLKEYLFHLPKPSTTCLPDNLRALLVLNGYNRSASASASPMSCGYQRASMVRNRHNGGAYGDVRPNSVSVSS